MVSALTIFSNIFGGLLDDFKKKNFSVYGQWFGILTIFLAIALGFANIFHLDIVIVFGIISVVQGFVVLFVEAPFLLRICPMTDKFTAFIRMFDENWPRCGFYLLMAVIQWLSLVRSATSLLVVASFFTVASGCYFFAAIFGQEFMKSSVNVTGAPADSVQGQVGEHIVRNVL